MAIPCLRKPTLSVLWLSVCQCYQIESILGDTSNMGNVEYLAVGHGAIHVDTRCNGPSETLGGVRTWGDRTGMPARQNDGSRWDTQSPGNCDPSNLCETQVNHAGSNHTHQVLTGGGIKIVMPETVDLPAIGFTSISELFWLTETGILRGRKNGVEPVPMGIENPDQGIPVQQVAL